MDFERANNTLTALREALKTRWQDDPEYGHPRNIQQRAKARLRATAAIKEVEATLKDVKQTLDRVAPLDPRVLSRMEKVTYRMVQAVKNHQWLVHGDN